MESRRDLLILGTDTDAGKTTFVLLWLARLHSEWSLWKPVETGPADSGAIARLVPEARVYPSVAHYAMPAAPPLAAAAEGRDVPSHWRIRDAKPGPGPLIIESFGGPFSPLTNATSQIDLIRLFDAECLLIGSSRLGAVGRATAMVEALHAKGVAVRGVVLIGPEDAWAEQTIERQTGRPVFGLRSPTDLFGPGDWTAAMIHDAANRQAATLDAISNCFEVEPEQSDWREIDRRCVWHPYTPLRGDEEPIAVASASMEHLRLQDGRRVIDAISSWWTILHGHCFPPLVAALREASRSIDHVVYAGASHRWGAELAEMLLATLGWNDGRVFYSDNGSTAVEASLKMAYQYWVHRGEPGRTLFVGFENSYHGDTFGAMALSRDPVFFGTFEPLLFKAEILPLDPNRLEQFLTEHRNDVAGVLLEPILQAAGGMRVHSEQTLRDLYEVTRRHDVLFLADEVMTGFGRTGTFWAHQSAGIAPDIVASAKTIAGGMLPLAATLASSRIVEAFDTADRLKTFFHGHSFTGHPLACAVGVENLHVTQETARSRIAGIESFWRTHLAEAVEWPGVREVRIRGTMAAVELDVAGGYLADVGRTIRRVALEHDVLLRPLGNVLYALPPYCTSPDSLGRIVDAMKASTRAAMNG